MRGPGQAPHQAPQASSQAPGPPPGAAASQAPSPPRQPPPQPSQPARPSPPRPQPPEPQPRQPKAKSAPPPLPGKTQPKADRPGKASPRAAGTRPSPPPTAGKPQPAAPAPAPPKREPPKPKPKVRPKPIRPESFVWAWPEEPPFEDEARPMRNAPAVDGQGRAILHGQNRLVALVEEEGKVRVEWEYVIGSPVPGPVTVADDGSIRAHCADGYLHCLNAAGRQQWSPVRVGEPLGYAAPVVDEQGSTYVSSYDGGLVRIDADGRLDTRRYFRSRRKLDSAGVIHRGVLYIGSEDGYVFAIELGEGRGTNLWDHAAEHGRTGWYVNSSPAIAADGTLIVAARDEHLYGFHPDGRRAWATKMPGQTVGSPVADGAGHIYVGAYQTFRGQEGRGFLVCIDGNSHKVRWQYAAAGEVESTPAVGDDGVIYFGDNSGTVHAVDLDGKARWTAQVESAVRSAFTILAPKRLAFGQDDDTLVVLECSSGGLALEGWPKFGRTLAQSGTV